MSTERANAGRGFTAAARSRRSRPLLVGRAPRDPRLLRRVLRDPEHARRQPPRRARVRPRAPDHVARAPPRDLPRADDPELGAALPAADPRSRTTTTARSTSSSRSSPASSCSAATPTTTRAFATRSRSRPLLALIGFTFYPLAPPRMFPRLRRHAVEGPRVLVVQFRRRAEGLESVRGHAERAHRVVDVVRARARARA